MLVAYPKFRIRPNQVARYRAAAEKLVAESLAEVGVVSYGVFEDISIPGTFAHVEVYVNQQAFDDHVGSAHVQRFLATLDAARYPDPEIQIFHVSESEMIEID